jgi:hypothetical protein
MNIEGIDSLKDDENNNLIKADRIIKNCDGNNSTRTEKTIKEEKKIESENDEEIKSAGKITGSAIRGVAEIGGIVIKALPEAGEITLETGAVVARAGISAGLKIASWILLPITCIGFGTWSIIKVHKDCQKILKIFEDASFPLIFETLLSYIESIEKTIRHLKDLGHNIIDDDENDNNL